MQSSFLVTLVRGVSLIIAAAIIMVCCNACNAASTQRAIAQRCQDACWENWGPGDGFVNCQACQQQQRIQ